MLENNNTGSRTATKQEKALGAMQNKRREEKIANAVIKFTFLTLIYDWHYSVDVWNRREGYASEKKVI